MEVNKTNFFEKWKSNFKSLIQKNLLETAQVGPGWESFDKLGNNMNRTVSSSFVWKILESLTLWWRFVNIQFIYIIILYVVKYDYIYYIYIYIFIYI